jgi:hypothetical protein
MWLAGIVTATGIIAVAASCFFVARATVNAVADIANGNELG